MADLEVILMPKIENRRVHLREEASGVLMFNIHNNWQKSTNLISATKEKTI